MIQQSPSLPTQVATGPNHNGFYQAFQQMTHARVLDQILSFLPTILQD